MVVSGVMLDPRTSIASTGGRSYMPAMHPDPDLKRLRWRAHHRGTREADLLVGRFFDRHAQGWDSGQLRWFAELLDEQDVDIIAWATGTAEAPERLAGPMMEQLRQLDYVRIAK